MKGQNQQMREEISVKKMSHVHNKDLSCLGTGHLARK